MNSGGQWCLQGVPCLLIWNTVRNIPACSTYNYYAVNEGSLGWQQRVWAVIDGWCEEAQCGRGKARLGSVEERVEESKATEVREEGGPRPALCHEHG